VKYGKKRPALANGDVKNLHRGGHVVTTDELIKDLQQFPKGTQVWFATGYADAKVVLSVYPHDKKRIVWVDIGDFET
jgi:hypothetical protein